MTFRSPPFTTALALVAAGFLTFTSSSAFADDEIPSARPAPPAVPEPPPNTSPPQVAAKEGETSGGQVDNAMFVELGGPAIIYSLNYDRRIGDYFSFRVGGSYLAATSGGATASAFLLPLTFNALIGGRAWSHFELGGGGMPFFGTFNTSSTKKSSGVGIIGVATMGYRLQAPGSGFFFRANINVLFGEGIAIPWPGLSFGASF